MLLPNIYMYKDDGTLNDESGVVIYSKPVSVTLGFNMSEMIKKL